MRAVRRVSVLALLLVVGCEEVPPDPMVGGEACPDGVVRRGQSISLDSQELVDELAGCTHIEGSALIGGSRVNRLEALASLERVDGDLQLGIDDEYSLLSLAGLEGMRSVGGSLYLSSVLARDLAPLAGLETLGDGEPSDLGFVGRLEIQSCFDLTTLSALQYPSGVRSLVLGNNLQLTSTEGVRVQAQAETISVRGQPLTDLAALTGVRTAAELDLGATQLTTLAGLENLEEVDSLSLWAGDLTSVAALESLVRVERLYLGWLFDVDTTGVFDQVAGLQSIQLERLRNVTVAFPQVVTLPGGLAVTYSEGIGMAGLTALKEVGSLRIVGNDITELSLPALERVTGDVTIASNNYLDHAVAEAFVAGLDVGGTVKIYANLGSPPAHDPCPYTGDGSCDEPLLCVTGADADDCGGSE